jgi:putative hydrolase of the HAD superfamily
MRRRTMTERGRYVIAYWLLPAAQARDFFHKTIRYLAAKCDAPLFEPHLTLAVGPEVPGEPDRTLARLTSGPVQLRILEVGFTAKFTKTLFVRFESSPPLLRLRDSLGPTEGEGFDPHLSLLYKTLAKTEQAQLADEIKMPFTTVTFDTVAATRCRLPVASPADVAIWKSIGSRRLDE